MKITLAALADFASVTVGDKLNVLGVFDRIAAKTFPAVHPQMMFAVRIMFEYDDGGQSYDLTVRLEDEDGKEVVAGSGTVVMPRIPPGETLSKNLILTLNNLNFRGPGRYRFIVKCGKEEFYIPFQVVQIT